jgi:hypothetical protein
MKFRKQYMMTDNELGYFLAGLIDADGHINKRELAITMHSKDMIVAEFLKHVIGGSIRKIKGRRAINYEVYSKASLSRVSHLIHDKLRLPHRVNQYNSYLVPKFNLLARAQKRAVYFTIIGTPGLFRVMEVFKSNYIKRKQRRVFAFSLRCKSV